MAPRYGTQSDFCIYLHGMNRVEALYTKPSGEAAGKLRVYQELHAAIRLTPFMPASLAA